MIVRELGDALQRAAQAEVLMVATDYDGTLSPIVPDPATAVPDEAALSALIHLGALPDTHVVVISGRSRLTLGRLTGSPAGITLIGSHGAESAGTEFNSELLLGVGELVDSLTNLAIEYPGCVVEEKPVGAAFHYRNTRLQQEAAAGARKIGERAGAQVIEGKMVIELVFGEVSKGAALQSLRRELSADSVVFVGDDVTDEAAFEVLGEGDTGIKVGEGETAAAWRISRQGDVAGLLIALEEGRRQWVLS